MREGPSARIEPDKAPPSDPAAISAPAMPMTGVRPSRAATGPANHAPAADPRSAMAATNPISPALSWSDGRMPGIAPFRLDVSPP